MLSPQSPTQEECALSFDTLVEGEIFQYGQENMCLFPVAYQKQQPQQHK